VISVRIALRIDFVFRSDR